MEKLRQANKTYYFETMKERWAEANFEGKMPNIEQRSMASLGDFLHGYFDFQEAFSNKEFHIRLPIIKDDSFVYTCEFINPERVEEYYNNSCNSMDEDTFYSWFEKLRSEKVYVNNIGVEVGNN